MSKLRWNGTIQLAVRHAMALSFGVAVCERVPHCQTLDDYTPRYSIESRVTNTTRTREFTVERWPTFLGEFADLPPLLRKGLERVYGDSLGVKVWRDEVESGTLDTGRIPIEVRRLAVPVGPRLRTEFGGHAEYDVVKTMLGELNWYTESLGGRERPFAWIERIMVEAKVAADALVKWLDYSLDGEPKWTDLRVEVREFLEGEFLDIGVGELFRASSASESRDRKVELRAQLAAVEMTPCVPRLAVALGGGGFRIGELPLLEPDSGVGFGTPTISALRARIRRILLDQGVADSALDFIVDDAQASSSWEAACENPLRKGFDAALRNLFVRPEHERGSSRAYASMSLVLESRPAATNGRVSRSESGQWRVSWGPGAFELDEMPACILYAIWATPYSVVQERVFGRVVLTGIDLSRYCSWRSNLSSASAAEWDEFLRQLEFSADPASAVRRFRFRTMDGLGWRGREWGPGLLAKNLSY